MLWIHFYIVNMISIKSYRNITCHAFIVCAINVCLHNCVSRYVIIIIMSTRVRGTSITRPTFHIHLISIHFNTLAKYSNIEISYHIFIVMMGDLVQSFILIPHTLFAYIQNTRLAIKLGNNWLNKFREMNISSFSCSLLFAFVCK